MGVLNYASIKVRYNSRCSEGDNGSLSRDHYRRTVVRGRPTSGTQETNTNQRLSFYDCGAM
jgi:hypothetical protein